MRFFYDHIVPIPGTGFSTSDYFIFEPSRASIYKLTWTNAFVLQLCPERGHHWTECVRSNIKSIELKFLSKITVQFRAGQSYNFQIIGQNMWEINNTVDAHTPQPEEIALHTKS